MTAGIDLGCHVTCNLPSFLPRKCKQQQIIHNKLVHPEISIVTLLSSALRNNYSMLSVFRVEDVCRKSYSNLLSDDGFFSKPNSPHPGLLLPWLMGSGPGRLPNDLDAFIVTQQFGW